MIGVLQHFLSTNGVELAAGSGVVALGLTALRYGRRHEQRTRERGPKL